MLQVEHALDAEPATNTIIRTVGIISRPAAKTFARVVPPLIEWLRAHGAEVVCDSETGECIGPLTGKTRKREELPVHSDLLIVLGGDRNTPFRGTSGGDRQVPILAVNLGGMGFLDDRTPGRALSDSRRNLFRKAQGERACAARGADLFATAPSSGGRLH